MKYPQSVRDEVMRRKGEPTKRVARELGVPETTVRRWLDPEFAARMRRLSNEAKQRRTGRCRKCGATTRYAGHGMDVSPTCVACANADIGLARRGSGPIGREAVALLATAHRYSEICRQLDIAPGYANVLLARLRSYGLIVRLSRGVYIAAASLEERQAA